MSKGHSEAESESGNTEDGKQDIPEPVIVSGGFRIPPVNMGNNNG